MNKIIKIDKPHLCNKEVWALITSRRLGKALAEETCSKRVQVWHSQVVWKPRSKGQKGNAGWHRDSQYWPFWSNEGLYTAWIALTDVSINSGPVRFLRGSNLWETVQGMDFFDQDIASQERILNKFAKSINQTFSGLNCMFQRCRIYFVCNHSIKGMESTTWVA